MKRKYRHLLFDLDHTIWDFETNSKAVLSKLHDTFNIHEKINEDFNTFFDVFSIINEKLWTRYRHGYMKQDELRWKRFWQTLLEFRCADEKLSRDMSDMYLELLPIQSELMPHALEVLEYCQAQGFRMHVITNGFEVTQLSKMKNSQIFHFFEEIVTSEKSMSLKPHNDIFKFTLDAIKAVPEECLMIGDNYEVDIVGAQNMNIDQVFYDPGKKYESLSSTYYIHDLKDIVGILN